jgi:8-oxo-dGTP pyrophosphatase MutT (NUDIX family)
MIYKEKENMKRKVSFLTRIKRLWAKRIFEQAAGTIVFYKINDDDQPKFLLIERGEPFNDWVFPKGKIKKKENRREAAVRETLEETGLKVKIVNTLSPEIYTYYWDPKNEKSTKKVHYFLAKTNTQTIPKDFHPEGYEGETFKSISFFDIQMAKNMVKHDIQRKLLEEAYNVIRSVKKQEVGGVGSNVSNLEL